MDKCKFCSKELIHIEGRKKKSFCNDNCRNKYFNKNKPKVKMKCVPLEEWNKIQDKIKMTDNRDNSLINAARGRDKSGINEDELLPNIDTAKTKEFKPSCNINYTDQESKKEFEKLKDIVKPEMQKQIDAYIEEIKGLGTTPLAKKRKTFCELKIEELKLMLKK